MPEQSFAFGLGEVIKGWREALQLMPVGSKWQLFIPSSLAYGTRGGNGGIGPNAVLKFDVELLAIRADNPEGGLEKAAAGVIPKKINEQSPGRNQ